MCSPCAFQLFSIYSRGRNTALHLFQPCREKIRCNSIKRVLLHSNNYWVFCIGNTMRKKKTNPNTAQGFSWLNVQDWLLAKASFQIQLCRPKSHRKTINLRILSDIFFLPLHRRCPNATMTYLKAQKYVLLT